MVPVLFAQSAADACGIDPSSICGLVYDLTGSSGFARLADLASRPVKVLLILLLAWVVNRVVLRWLDRVVETWVTRRTPSQAADSDSDQADSGKILGAAALRRALQMEEQQERAKQRTRTLGGVLRSIASVVVYSVAVMMALGEFDVNLGPLIAGAGIVGVAIGFGAQSLVKDFLSGVFMLLEDQYGVGDVVDVGETAGVVEEVKLRITQIRDINGTLWHIPNGEIARVANLTKDWGRAVIDVEVSYDTDISTAMEVIKGVADGLWREELEQFTITEEPTLAGVQAFGENSVAIRLMVKTEPGEHWGTARELRKRLKYALDEAGIEIPFPQRTIWVRPQPNTVPPTESDLT